MLFEFDAQPPGSLARLRERAKSAGFVAASDDRTGALLRTLAASKPGGRILELGTGVGVGTAWLLAGMDAAARIESVDHDAGIQEYAREELGGDPRVVFHALEGKAFIAQAMPNSFDLVFADAWSGKFHELEQTLALLKLGGFYVIDDMLPQPNWPDNHQPRSTALVATLEADPALQTLRLDWSTGLIVAVKLAN